MRDRCLRTFTRIRALSMPPEDGETWDGGIRSG